MCPSRSQSTGESNSTKYVLNVYRNKNIKYWWLMSFNTQQLFTELLFYMALAYMYCLESKDKSCNVFQHSVITQLILQHKT